MIIFDDDNYRFGRSLDADGLVEIYHYSHHIPSNIQFCVTQIQDEKSIASCFFAISATRWAEPVLELCRLVRDETVEPKPILTKLISVGVKQLNREKKFDLIVSFADSTHNHHGGIYQACSWNFHIRRKARLDGFIIDGILVAARTCNHRYGTSGMKLVQMMNEQGIECIPHYDTGKYLYWKALDKNGEQKAVRLGLTKSGYPKPMSI